MENCHLYIYIYCRWFTYEKWWFSIAMLVWGYQHFSVFVAKQTQLSCFLSVTTTLSRVKSDDGPWLHLDFVARSAKNLNLKLTLAQRGTVCSRPNGSHAIDSPVWRDHRLRISIIRIHWIYFGLNFDESANRPWVDLGQFRWPRPNFLRLLARGRVLGNVTCEYMCASSMMGYNELPGDFIWFYHILSMLLCHDHYSPDDLSPRAQEGAPCGGNRFTRHGVQFWHDHWSFPTSIVDLPLKMVMVHRFLYIYLFTSFLLPI